MLRLSRSCIHISAREPPWFSLGSPAPRTTPSSRAGHGLSRLWLAGLRGGFRLLTVQLIYTFARHALNQQFGERPYQGINAVRRIPRRCAVKSRFKICHLVFKLREGADVMDAALLVQRPQRFGP